MASSIPTDPFRVKVDSIRDRQLLVEHFKECLEIMAEPLKNDTKHKEALEKIQSKIEIFKKEILDQKKMLNNINNLKDLHLETLELPENFGTESTYNIEELCLYVPIFENAHGKTSLKEFWRKIHNFAALKNLSEDSYKSMLACRLSGDAYETYFHNRQKKLTEILQILVDRFGSLETIQDYEQQLNNLKRGSDETLQSIMQRTAMLLELTASLFSEEDRPSRYKTMMKSYLYKFCNDNAKHQLNIHRASASRQGFTLDYNQLFEIAKMAEDDQF